MELKKEPLDKQPILYIGIGASAGGQEALCAFFTHLPPNLSAAYFVITHLSRDHKSQLCDIIGRRTAMPVVTVCHPMQVQAGSVYFLVENTILGFDPAGLTVKCRTEGEKINRAIDIFFISLAKYHGDRAVGIVLSGGGEDGVAGAIEIHNHGGTVLVQDPGSSQFSGMPNAIIARDHPLAVLSPADLARRVVELADLSVHK